MTTVAVVMPVYNEHAGITEFLDEIATHFADLDLRLFVADDCSTDETIEVLEQLSARLPITILPGARNQGHGPTTLRALHAGLSIDPDVVVAVDGDGQFVGEDLRRVVGVLLNTTADIVEGIRTGRDDPFFRRATSWTTRALVRARAHVPAADANTPLRVYRPTVLAQLLAVLPDDAMTPNLLISSLARLWGLSIIEVPAVSIPRRGGDPAGTSWQARRKSLPSKRFVRFCVGATRQWVALPVAQRPPES